jgi:hypothetical protein
MDSHFTKKKLMRSIPFYLVLLLAGNVSAQTYVNSSTGSDAGDGTAGNPYKTFNKGYTMVASGGTIDLTGTFTWTDVGETGDAATTGFTINKDVTITGQGAGVTFVQADAAANTADRGVFTIPYGKTVTINSMTIRNGKTSGDGGGVNVVGSSAINNCEICYNYSGSAGGGVDVRGTLTIQNSTIHDNSTINMGGGINRSYYSGTSGVPGSTDRLDIINCTITLNTVTAPNGYFDGGGVFFRRGYGSITNSTITGNKITLFPNQYTQGVGIDDAATSVVLKNNIIVNNYQNLNSGGDIGTRSGSGTYTDNGNNVIGRIATTAGDGFSSFASTTWIDGLETITDGTFILQNGLGTTSGSISISGTLANNNTTNFTQTLALGSCSIAINAGATGSNGPVTVPATDQRGFSRVGNVDIGAYEFTGASANVSVNPATLTGFSYTYGSGPSTAQSFTVSGTNLSDNLALTAPTNYEISTGGAYSGSVPLTQTGGTVAETTVNVRLKAGLAVGNYNNQTIAITATCVSQAVTCSGSVTPGPAIVTNPATLAFGYNASGTTSSEMTFALSGSNLSPSSGDLTVTPPANFEVSKTTGSGFSASAITVAYTGGTLASTTIYVRFKPTSPATNYSGNIACSGGGATTQNVAVTGTTNLTYCSASTNTTDHMGINHVVFNTIDKTTPNVNPGYSDFTAISTNVAKGQTYTLTLTGWGYTQYFKVWFDWNLNGSFADANEEFTVGTNGVSTYPVSCSILIPATATTGNVRMRVRSNYTSASQPVACGVVEYGECEDYTLNVVVPTSVWNGSTSSDWNTAGNWNPATVPTASYNVTIPSAPINQPVVNQSPATPAVCNDLTITSGGLLSINAGKALTVNGTFINNVGVTGLSIESDAVNGSGSLLHYTADVPAYLSTTILGSAALTDYKYHLVSVPLTPASFPTSLIFEGLYLYDFNVAANDWHGLGTSTTTALDVTKGYMVYRQGGDINLLFEGNLNVGAFSPTVVHSGSGYNLVPNPYPSSIDWNAASGWTKTNIDNSIWIWNSAATEPYGSGIVGNYAAFVGGTGTNGGSRYIAPGQAFFVKTNAASPALTMNDAVRLHNATPFLKSGESIADLLRVKANANNYSDEAVVRFTEGSTQMADANFDAEKMFGLENAPQLYTLTQGNEKLSINSLPSLSGQNSVPLNFETQFTGVVNLTFVNMESFDPSINLYLKDELTNQTINLRKQAAYTFNHNPANDANRFKLIFGGTYGIEENESLAGNMWIAGNTLYINTPKFAGEKAKVEVYSAAGQSLMAKNLVLDALTTLDLNMQGFVIVKLTSGQTVLTSKGILIK